MENTIEKNTKISEFRRKNKQHSIDFFTHTSCDKRHITFQGDKEIEIERADRTVTAEVTFQISFGTEVMGNVTFGLFGKQCPKTVRNFVTLANPLRAKGEGYKGSKIHRIVRGFAIQGI